MGEYADWSWQGYLRNGMRYNPDYVPKKRPRCSCICCGKQVEASDGLLDHWRMKHRMHRKFFKLPISPEDFKAFTACAQQKREAVQ